MSDNKITVDQMNAVYNLYSDNTYDIKINTLEKPFTIQFKLLEELYLVSAFIDKVVDSCFLNGEFKPEYVEPLFLVTMLQMMSNVEIPKFTDDDGSEYTDIGLVYKWMQKMDLMNAIMSSDVSYYVRNLREMVDIKIDDMRKINYDNDNEIIEELKLTFIDIRNLIKKLGTKISKFNPEKSMKKLEKIMTPENQSMIQKMLDIFTRTGEVENSVVGSVPDNITKLKQ